MQEGTSVDRRSVLKAVGGVATAGMVGLAGCTSGDGDGEGDADESSVTVGPGGSLVYDPAELTVSVGDTVTWTWESDTHNIVVEKQPPGANWPGTEGGESELYDTGYEYEFTFETAGTYDYYCSPHRSAGMTGTIVVEAGESGGTETEQ